jgi:hypothetical protein
MSPLVIGFVCGDAVLRSLFSEERARQVESVRYCGAAKQVIAERESEGCFLFQICITLGDWSRFRGIFLFDSSA